MGKTAALFHFEEVAGLQPHDAVGGLDDLVVPAGLTTPPIVDGIFGRARSFPSGSGFEGLELVANQLRLRRSMSIEAIVSIDALRQVNGRHTIIARGRRGAVGERRLFSLFVDVTGAPGAPVCKLGMGWDQGTAPAYVPGVYFDVTAPGFVYLCVTREWVSAGVVRVSYYANDKALGTFTVTGGAIADGDGGHTTVGMEGAGAGVYTNYFLDAIDDLRVSNVVRSPEEVQSDYLRMFQFQPWGYDMIRMFANSLGDNYSRNEDAQISRELMVEGDALGFAWAQLNELLTNTLPDRSTKRLDRWEAICRIQPGPTDSIQTRRNRILAFMQQVAGYTVDKIVTAVAPVLACTPDQLEIIENRNDGVNPEKVWLWFIKRDPALPGTPDIPTAQRIIDQMKPAHTRGLVGESTSFKCDDPHSLTDRDLLGE